MKKNSLTTAIIAGVAGVAGLAGVAQAVHLNADGIGPRLTGACHGASVHAARAARVQWKVKRPAKPALNFYCPDSSK